MKNLYFSEQRLLGFANGPEKAAPPAKEVANKKIEAGDGTIDVNEVNDKGQKLQAKISQFYKMANRLKPDQVKQWQEWMNERVNTINQNLNSNLTYAKGVIEKALKDIDVPLNIQEAPDASDVHVVKNGNVVTVDYHQSAQFCIPANVGWLGCSMNMGNGRMQTQVTLQENGDGKATIQFAGFAKQEFSIMDNATIHRKVSEGAVGNAPTINKAEAVKPSAPIDYDEFDRPIVEEPKPAPQSQYEKDAGNMKEFKHAPDAATIKEPTVQSQYEKDAGDMKPFQHAPDAATIKEPAVQSQYEKDAGNMKEFKHAPDAATIKEPKSNTEAPESFEAFEKKVNARVENIRGLKEAHAPANDGNVQAELAALNTLLANGNTDYIQTIGTDVASKTEKNPIQGDEGKYRLEFNGSSFSLKMIEEKATSKPEKKEDEAKLKELSGKSDAAIKTADKAIADNVNDFNKRLALDTAISAINEELALLKKGPGGSVREGVLNKALDTFKTEKGKMDAKDKAAKEVPPVGIPPLPTGPDTASRNIPKTNEPKAKTFETPSPAAPSGVAKEVPPVDIPPLPTEPDSKKTDTKTERPKDKPATPDTREQSKDKLDGKEKLEQDISTLEGRRDAKIGEYQDFIKKGLNYGGVHIDDAKQIDNDIKDLEKQIDEKKQALEALKNAEKPNETIDETIKKVDDLVEKCRELKSELSGLNVKKAEERTRSIAILEEKKGIDTKLRSLDDQLEKSYKALDRKSDSSTQKKVEKIVAARKKIDGILGTKTETKTEAASKMPALEQAKFDAATDNWGRIGGAEAIDKTGVPYIYCKGDVMVDGKPQTMLFAYSKASGYHVMNCKGEWKKIDKSDSLISEANVGNAEKAFATLPKKMKIATNIPAAERAKFNEATQEWRTLSAGTKNKAGKPYEYVKKEVTVGDTTEVRLLAYNPSTKGYLAMDNKGEWKKLPKTDPLLAAAGKSPSDKKVT